MVNVMFPTFFRVLVLVALAAMVTSTQTPSRVVKPASHDKSRKGKGHFMKSATELSCYAAQCFLAGSPETFRGRKVKLGGLV